MSRTIDIPSNDIDVANSIKGLKELQKHFDYVELDFSNDRFNVLRLSDKPKNTISIINKSVWLELKINKQHDQDNPKFIGKGSIEQLEKCIDKILLFIDILRDSLIEKDTVQLSLFEELSLDTVELEKVPEPPRDGSDRKWSAHARTEKKINLSNLKKQFTFMELFDPYRSGFIYNDIDFRNTLPSKEEVINELKRVVSKYKVVPDGKDKAFNRFDDGWFDSPDYIMNKSLSDFELYQRIMQVIRLFFCEYVNYEHMSYSLDYKPYTYSKDVDYRFYFDGSEFTYDCMCDYDKEDLPYYNLFDEDLIAWLRKELNVKVASQIDEEHTLLTSLKHLMNGLNLFDDYEAVLAECTNEKQFLKKVSDAIAENRPQSDVYSSTMHLNDGFKYIISFDRKKPEVSVVQEESARKLLYGEDNKKVFYEINKNDVYKKVFQMLKTEGDFQGTFF